MGTWDAVLWWSGFAPRLGRVPPDYEAGVVHLYQLHHDLTEDWRLTRDAGRAGQDTGPARRSIAASLATVRATMRKRGLLLPELPADLASAIAANGEGAPAE
jgi:hypothetical protein